MRTRKYKCPDCQGTGQELCQECGAVHDCDYCDGSGLDPDKVDIDGFRAAEHAAMTAARSSVALSVALPEGDEIVGRVFSNGVTLRYEDFKAKGEDDDQSVRPQ